MARRLWLRCVAVAFLLLLMGCPVGWPTSGVPSEETIRAYMGELLPEKCLVNGYYHNRDVPTVVFRFKEEDEKSQDWMEVGNRFAERAQSKGWKLVRQEGREWTFQRHKKLETGRYHILKTAKMVVSDDGWSYVAAVPFGLKEAPKTEIDHLDDKDARWARGFIWPLLADFSRKRYIKQKLPTEEIIRFYMGDLLPERPLLEGYYHNSDVESAVFRFKEEDDEPREWMEVGKRFAERAKSKGWKLVRQEGRVWTFQRYQRLKRWREWRWVSYRSLQTVKIVVSEDGWRYVAYVRIELKKWPETDIDHLDHIDARWAREFLWPKLTEFAQKESS